MTKAIGDKEKMRFPKIIRLKIMKKRILIHSKLLLTVTNLRNDKRNSGELNPRTFSQRSKIDVKFENFNKAPE